MWQPHNSILHSISKALHAHYDDINKEPLPVRWVDLIRYLNEKERQSVEAPAPGVEPLDQSAKKKETSH